MTVTLSHIVAAAENDVIGREGGLPWHIPEDLKFLKIRLWVTPLLWAEKPTNPSAVPCPNA